MKKKIQHLNFPGNATLWVILVLALSACGRTMPKQSSQGLTAPKPSPTATPDPSPTPAPSATPDAGANPDAGATPAPTATPDPGATPTPTATPDPSASPAPSATPDPSASPAPSATPDPSASPAPSATPVPSTSPAANPPRGGPANRGTPAPSPAQQESISGHAPFWEFTYRKDPKDIDVRDLEGDWQVAELTPGENVNLDQVQGLKVAEHWSCSPLKEENRFLCQETNQAGKTVAVPHRLDAGTIHFQTSTGKDLSNLCEKILDTRVTPSETLLSFMMVHCDSGQMNSFADPIRVCRITKKQP